MASLNFGVNDPNTVKLWSKAAWKDSVKETLYGKMIGTSDRSIIQTKDETSKSEGDRIRFALRSLPRGLGVQDEETLEGKEEGAEFTNFDLTLGEKRYATKVDLNLSEQRTMFNVRSEGKAMIEEWCAEYLDTTMFEYLTGIGQGPVDAPLAPLGTYGSRYHPTAPLGGNALEDYAANRQVFGGAAANIGALTVNDTMSLMLVDRLVERAKLASPTMRPAMIDGKKLWVLVLHPFQVSAMRANTSTGQWLDIQKTLTQGGFNSQLVKEGLGIYRDVLMLESTRIPRFLGGAGNAVQCARAVFLGAQAGTVAYGRKTSGYGKLAMAERTIDYGKRLGQAVTFIWGMRRSRFTNQSDFASFAVNTAAAPM